MLLYVILFYVKCRPYTDMTLFCHSSVLFLLSRLFTWIYWSIYIPLGDLFPPRPSFFPFFLLVLLLFVVVVLLLLHHLFLLCLLFLLRRLLLLCLWPLRDPVRFILLVLLRLLLLCRLHLHRSRLFLRRVIRLDLMM